MRMPNGLPAAWRMTMRSPGFSLACIATLALAIGANVAIYSLVDAFLLRPLPFPDSERLTALYQFHPAWGSRLPVSVPTYLDWRDRSTAFEEVGAFTIQPAVLSGDFPAQRLEVGRATPNFLPLLGRNPQPGRHFAADQEGLGLQRQILLSHALWQRLFGGREEALGMEVRLDGAPYEIIGAMAPGPSYPSGIGKASVDLWIPLLCEGEERSDRDRFFLQVVAKRREGISLQGAQAGLASVAAMLAHEHPEAESLPVHAADLKEEVTGRLRPALLVFWGAVGFLLLLACTNIASLLLARGHARQEELAVRAALGAGRTRLLVQLLAESLLLALLGGAAALAASHWAISALVTLYPGDLPRLSPVGLDLRVAAFALALSAASGLALGALPAVSAVRGDNLGQVLRGGAGRGASRRRTQMLKLLVGGEIALAVVLSCGAGLAGASFWKLLHVERGFDPENVAVARIWLPQEGYSDAQAQSAFYDAFLSRAGEAPGILSAGAIQSSPLGEGRWSSFFRAQDFEADEESLPTADFRVVLGDYFETLRIAVLQGRPFGPQDAPQAEPVAIVNQALAQRIWPGRDPTGLRIAATGAEGEGSWATVVGVVENIKHSNLRQSPRSVIYRPWRQHPVRDMDVVLRGGPDIMALMPSLKVMLNDLGPSVPALEADSLKGRVARHFAQERFATMLLGLFALSALLLGVAGTYALVSFSVARRRREIGIRMALGAGRAQVRRLFLLQGGRLIAAGSAVGVLASLALTRLMQSLLFEVSPLDPAILLASASAVAASALAATWLPSRRAAATDPVRTLNSQ